MLTDELASPIVILELYRRVAAEVSRLDVIPPGYEALRSKHNRRNPINYELIPGALARMRCADWWQRKLWQLRNEWRALFIGTHHLMSAMTFCCRSGNNAVRRWIFSATMI